MNVTKLNYTLAHSRCLCCVRVFQQTLTITAIIFAVVAAREIKYGAGGRIVSLISFSFIYLSSDQVFGYRKYGFHHFAAS